MNPAELSKRQRDALDEHFYRSPKQGLERRKKDFNAGWNAAVAYLAAEQTASEGETCEHNPVAPTGATISCSKCGMIVVSRWELMK